MSAEQAKMAGVVDQALVYCRPHTEQQRRALCQLWADSLGDLPVGEIRKAVSAWIGMRDDEEIQNRTAEPPLPGALRRLVERNRTTPPDRHPTNQWAVASREFAQAHLQAQRKIQRLAVGGPMPLEAAFEHKHEQPTFDEDGKIVTLGNEACAACLSPGEQKTVRDAIEAVLAKLPLPAVSARSCRCDGSGMVDTPEALESLLSVSTGPREVFPCPQCNPDAFQRYQEGEYAPVRT